MTKQEFVDAVADQADRGLEARDQETDRLYEQLAGRQAIAGFLGADQVRQDVVRASPAPRLDQLAAPHQTQSETIVRVGIRWRDVEGASEIARRILNPPLSKRYESGTDKRVRITRMQREPGIEARASLGDVTGAKRIMRLREATRRRCCG